MSFSGFSDESEEPSVITSSKPKNNTNRRQKEKLLLAAANQKSQSIVSVSGESLPPAARLSATPVKLKIADNGTCEVVSSNPPSPSSQLSTSTTSSTLPEISASEPTTAITSEDPSSTSTTTPNKDEIVDNDRASKLTAFQEKQKLIEEQNRKKKEMLSKAINDRKKKTEGEARKLDVVHKELEKIDLMLNTDVKFLRDSIEQASLDFMEAQKRYDKAEREFIDAKLHLHNCGERKELLTDHLCAIIEQVKHRKTLNSRYQSPVSIINQ